MPIYEIDFGGRKFDLDAPDEGAALGAVQRLAETSKRAANQPGPLDTAIDVGKSALSGLGVGATDLLGIRGNLAHAALGAGEWAADKIGIPQSFRMPHEYAAKIASVVGGPSGQDIRDFAAPVTGKPYEPQTTLGKYTGRVAEFAPNALLSPGTAAMRLTAGVVAPAVASEAAGQATEGGKWEGVARVGGAVAGGLAGGGAAMAANRMRSEIPGLTGGTSRVLEKTMLPTAEARLADLGPQALLMEATEPAFGIGQTLATRPGAGQAEIIGALKARQADANRRLGGELNATLGPAEVPSIVEGALAKQRQIVGKDYTGAAQGVQRLDATPIIKKLTRDIDLEAGGPKKTLTEIRGYLFKQQRYQDAEGQWQTKQVPKTSAEELLNVRQAIDDLISRTTEPNTLRLASKYRSQVDDLMPPTIKAVDERFSELAKQSEALTRGGQVLNIGKEAIRPVELAQEMAGMSGGQKSLLRVGARAELDRLVGTKANDATALKQLMQSEGDWNRTKLSNLFGMPEADRILRSVDREAAFQDAYRKVLENSQTAQRLGGARLIDDNAGATPSLRDMTITGALVSGLQKTVGGVRNMVTSAHRAAAEDELGRVLATAGPERDAILRQVRDAQAAREASAIGPGNVTLQALINANAGDHNRERSLTTRMLLDLNAKRLSRADPATRKAIEASLLTDDPLGRAMFGRP